MKMTRLVMLSLIVAGATPLFAETAGQSLFIGDSLMKEVGRAARRELAKNGKEAVVESSIGSGLARLDLYDWPAKFRTMCEQKPRRAVVLMGANDEQSLNGMGGGVPYGSDDWSAEYKKRIATMLDIAKETKVALLWVGLPKMRDDRADKHASLVNKLVKECIATSGHGTFLDTEPVYSVDGGFSPFILIPPNDKILKVRSEDGIHFSRQGAMHLAKLIMKKFE